MITREQFEEIVGDAKCDWFGDDYVEVWNDKGDPLIGFNLTIATPLQVRFGCFAIGIRCDWDEPVSFERLMAIEGARSTCSNVVDFSTPTRTYAFIGIDNGETITWRCNKTDKVTTMRQVHLLLSAAGVGE